MRKIIRAPIRGVGKQMFTLPEDSKIIHARMNPAPDEIASLYIVTDTEKPAVHVYIHVIRETEDVPGDAGDYIGSFVDGCYVWHVFKG